MRQLELTEPEWDLLREIAEEWLSELRTEIAATDSASYREGLKARESLLHDILARLGTAVP